MKHLVYVAMIGLLAAGAQAREVVEPAGSIPVVQDVDVVVVGGAAGGVEAALAAAKQGAKVFLVAPRPYLGEDICATYRLWLEPGEVASTALAQDVFKPQPLNSGVGPGLPFTYTANVATSGSRPARRPASTASVSASSSQPATARNPPPRPPSPEKRRAFDAAERSSRSSGA